VHRIECALSSKIREASQQPCPLEHAQGLPTRRIEFSTCGYQTQPTPEPGWSASQLAARNSSPLREPKRPGLRRSGPNISESAG
jgi:hypothetical protein